jgi:hypothetical protein
MIFANLSIIKFKPIKAIKKYGRPSDPKRGYTEAIAIFLYPWTPLYPVGIASGDNLKDFPNKRASCTKKLAVSSSPSLAIDADIWISICTNPASTKSEQELKISGS